MHPGFAYVCMLLVRTVLSKVCMCLDADLFCCRNWKRLSMVKMSTNFSTNWIGQCKKLKTSEGQAVISPWSLMEAPYSARLAHRRPIGPMTMSL